VHRSGEFHMMIGRHDLHGHGIGTTATRQMLRHGFLDLNLTSAMVCTQKLGTGMLARCAR